MSSPDLVCWEALDAGHPAVEQARRLYEATQASDERIPWRWIAGAVADRPKWRPGRWGPHLVVAAGRAARGLGAVIGFAYGVHLPGQGGYLSYLGVEPAHRGKGVGTRLIRLMTALLTADACTTGDELPYVLWESRAPAAGGARALWRSRLRLFERAGAWWVGGVTFHAVNYHRRGAQAVPLQLFLLPVAKPAAAFDEAALREAVAGLASGVYGLGADHPFMRASLPEGARPELRPVAEAIDLGRGEPPGLSL